MPIGNRILQWTALSMLAAGPWSLAAGQEPAKPLAGLISELSGNASIRTTQNTGPIGAQRFDGMADGATLALGPQSRAVIVLAGGRRFDFGPNARATIAAKQLTATAGPITELPRLSPLPRIAALDDSRPKGPPGGVRLRDATISGLHPSHAVTLADRTVLRFNPVVGASRYGVEIENDTGQRIFMVESTTFHVMVPVGVLKPDASYYWTVQALDKFGMTPRGRGEFRTLSAADAHFREALRTSLQAEADGGALALLAEIDRRLGLYQEALDGFRAQLARTPDDVAVQRALRRLEQTLEKSASQ